MAFPDLMVAGGWGKTFACGLKLMKGLKLGGVNENVRTVEVLLFGPRMDTDSHGSEITKEVLAAAFEVANVLGAGFLEKVYKRALVRELVLRGLKAEAQVPFPVRYKGQRIGDYVADLVVEERVIVELKCVERLASDHVAQCINYLKASGLSVGLLVNFQKPKVEWKRVLLD